MNLSRRMLAVLTVFGLIGEAISGVKIIIDVSKSNFWSSMNGWYVMFVLCSVALIALALVWFYEKIEERFAFQQRAMKGADDELSRAISGLNSQYDLRVGTLATELNAQLKKEVDALKVQLKKEADNRCGMHSAAVNLIDAVNQRIGLLETRVPD